MNISSLEDELKALVKFHTVVELFRELFSPVSKATSQNKLKYLFHLSLNVPLHHQDFMIILSCHTDV